LRVNEGWTEGWRFICGTQRCEVTPLQAYGSHCCLWDRRTRPGSVWERLGEATGAEVWILTPLQNNKPVQLFFQGT